MKPFPTILYIQNKPSSPVLGAVGNDAGKFYPCCSRPFHNGDGGTEPYILVTEHKEMARLATAAVLEDEATKAGTPPEVSDRLVARANAIKNKKTLAVVENDPTNP